MPRNRTGGAIAPGINIPHTIAAIPYGVDYFQVQQYTAYVGSIAGNTFNNRQTGYQIRHPQNVNGDYPLFTQQDTHINDIGWTEAQIEYARAIFRVTTPKEELPNIHNGFRLWASKTRNLELHKAS